VLNVSVPMGREIGSKSNSVSKNSYNLTDKVSYGGRISAVAFTGVIISRCEFNARTRFGCGLGESDGPTCNLYDD